MGVDLFDAAERDQGPPGSGIIVYSEAIHLWLPESLALLASPEGRREFLKDHESLRRFLSKEGRRTLAFAVTYRGYRVDGGWTDATFVRRPHDGAASWPELRDVTAGDDLGPSKCAAIHIVSEGMLRLESAAMIEEMRRITADGDLHRQAARPSVAGLETPL
jgi:hypothetical protein